MPERYAADTLRGFAAALFSRAGLPEDRARVVADILLEGDLLGHTTHGLQLIGPYLKKIQAGEMTRAGVPEVIQDCGSTVVWDGGYLPGPWLVLRALELAQSRLAAHGVVMVVNQLVGEGLPGHAGASRRSARAGSRTTRPRTSPGAVAVRRRALSGDHRLVTQPRGKARGGSAVTAPDGLLIGFGSRKAALGRCAGWPLARDGRVPTRLNLPRLANGKSAIQRNVVEPQPKSTAETGRTERGTFFSTLCVRRVSAVLFLLRKSAPAEEISADTGLPQFAP